MIVAACTHESKKKNGRDRNGNQRYRCCLCGQTFADQVAKPIGDMRISLKEASTALGMLLEGLSVRATSRLTGLDRNTICDLILTVGGNCQRLLDETIKGVQVNDIELDEIWSFVGCKEKTRIREGHGAEIGDSWTFIAVERTTKLVLAHLVGQRESATCSAFLRKLDRATVGRFQLSSDGLGSYRMAVPFILGSRVDFAQLIKNYRSTQTETRYSPAKIINAEKKPRFGRPDFEKICTSHVERLNLTLRMTMRRFTRLTNAHSKSHKHHVAMQAIFFAWYNLCRKHESLGGETPAMASNLTDHVWTIKELAERAASA